MQTDNSKTLTYILALSTAVIYCLAWYLAYIRGLTSTLEAESAMTAREFLRGGYWAVNYMNGMPDYDKPSFFYWLIALASFFTGGIRELSVRIPSLLASLAIMLMFIPYNNERKPGMACLPAVAAFIFISCPKVFWMTQLGRMDMTLSMFCFGTITAFILYSRENMPSRRKNVCYWLFFLLSGFSVLTKGPVGILITWPPVIFFLIFKRNWKEIRRIFLSRGIFLFLFITVPWYLAACINTDWQFFRHFFLEESLSRFGNIWSGIEFKQFNRSNAGLYLVYFLTGFFPWSILFPIAVVMFIRNKPDSYFKMKHEHAVLVTYIIWIFFFFSLCGVKRSDYILPLYPAAAIITGDFLSAIYLLDESRYRHIFINFSRIVTGISAVITATLSVTAIFFASETGRQLSVHLIPQRVGAHLNWFQNHLPTVLLIVIPANMLTGWLLFRFKKTDISYRYMAVMAGSVTAAWLFSAGIALPFIDYCKEMRPYCAKIACVVKKSPLYSYHFWDEECAFYLNRKSIPRIGKGRLLELLHQRQDKIFIMIRDRELEQMKHDNIAIPWILSPDAACWRQIYVISNMKDRLEHK